MLFKDLQFSPQFVGFWYMTAHIGNKFAEGNEGGRPTKFTADTLKIAQEYIADCEDSTDDNGRLNVSLPTVAGLAIRLGVSRETIYAWKSEDKEFSDVYQELMAKQEVQLLNNGLSSKYNSNIVKLMLGKHGYSDKQELLGKDGDKLEMGVVILPAKNEDTLGTTE